MAICGRPPPQSDYSGQPGGRGDDGGPGARIGIRTQRVEGDSAQLKHDVSGGAGGRGGTGGPGRLRDLPRRQPVRGPGRGGTSRCEWPARESRGVHYRAGRAVREMPTGRTGSGPRHELEPHRVRISCERHRSPPVRRECHRSAYRSHCGIGIREQDTTRLRGTPTRSASIGEVRYASPPRLKHYERSTKRSAILLHRLHDACRKRGSR